MGNTAAKLKACCFSGAGDRHDSAGVTSESCDEGLGHFFCYVRPEPPLAPSSSSSKVHHSEETTTTFRSISGAAISANTATPLSTALESSAGATFESSTTFSSAPLHPVPRFSGPFSGPIDRGFLSGPIDRGVGFMSGPLDPRSSTSLLSGPLERRGPLRRSFSHGLALHRRAAVSLLRSFTKSISRSISVPFRESDSSGSSSALQQSSFAGDASDGFDAAGACGGENVHWAQGRAGEDRVHVVISEEHSWLFVGIYDGFNGPDATDYLLSKLYAAVQQELKGLLWDVGKEEAFRLSSNQRIASGSKDDSFTTTARNSTLAGENRGEINPGIDHRKRKSSTPAWRWEENQRWKYEWPRERFELDRCLRNQWNLLSSGDGESHPKVLEALSQALKKTEETFLETADMIVSENPELALMGSCVLVMVMKGEDVYLMNVGDSRAVLAQKVEPEIRSFVGKDKQILDKINEEILHDHENYGNDQMDGLQNLIALQLTKDHSTSVKEEVMRIRNQHPEDASSIVNDRVKGSLKVTRAFGAGFLKQPKWNNALLEMFRINYIGTLPYITCSPFLYHHRLSYRDQFLILSSDGLYQYFTNEEAIIEVQLFIAANPEGDPAQHLVEEVLFRAAKNAGMDFHELLEIPQGERRRYHDDVSIIVISFEGRIWRSFM